MRVNREAAMHTEKAAEDPRPPPMGISDLIFKMEFFGVLRNCSASFLLVSSVRINEMQARTLY